MKREFLRSLELDDEVIGKIMAENGKDIENVKAKYHTDEELESKISELKCQYDKDIAQMKLDSALGSALGKSGARNSKALKGLLEMDKISLNGEKLVGFDEQLEGIKNENPYLFEEDSAPRIVSRTDGTNFATDSAARSVMGLK